MGSQSRSFGISGTGLWSWGSIILFLLCGCCLWRFEILEAGERSEKLGTAADPKREVLIKEGERRIGLWLFYGRTIWWHNPSNPSRRGSRLGFTCV